MSGAPEGWIGQNEGEATMKFMLMMNAPRGDGDWNVASWAPEDLKAHIGFMKQLHEDLSEAGELVGAEGLAPPGQARRPGDRGRWGGAGPIAGATEVV